MLKKRHTLPLMTLLLCVVFAVLLPVMALAAAVADFSSFTYASYFTAVYTVESTAGNASASGATISLDATGVDATTGCNSTAAVSSTTTVTLTATETVSVTCTPGSNVTATYPSEVTENADGSKTFIVQAGQKVSFAVKASNATTVSGTVTFSGVEPATSSVPADCAAYSYNGKVYNYLDKVLTDASANGSGTIVVTGDGKVYHSSVETDEDYASKSFTYDIPSGVALLVPYSDSDYVIDTSTHTDSSGNLESTWIHANNAWTSALYAKVSGVLEPNTSVFRSLTIPSGTTLNVASGGKFVIGGTIVSGTSGTTGVAGATAGPHGNVTVNGTINVNSGGILSTCGYILGGGSVNVAGGSVYQPFTLADYHDGHHTVNCTKNATFPANRYTMQNIQAPLTVSSGGRIYGYIDIYTQTTASIIKQRHNVACEIIVGQAGDDALIKLASGATMTSTYNPNDYVTITSGALGKEFYSKLGKHAITISGGAALGSLDLTVNVAGTNYTVHSSDCDFPISYQYDFTLQNGTYTLPYSLSLLPGASMKVASSADLVVSSGSFVVFDGLRDHIIRDTADVNINSWYEYHYPSTANLQSKGYNGLANLIVEGSLTVNSGASFGGYVQTSGTGIVDMKGTASATAGIGNVVKYGGIVNAYAGRTERTLNAWLFAQNGNLIAAETGKSYTAVNSGAHTVDGYAYRVYTKAGDTSTYTDLTATLGTNVTGSWQCAEGYHTDEDPADHTCDVCGFVTECVDAIPEGETYADHICDICGKVLSECSDAEDDEDILCDTCGKILCAHAEVTAIAEDPATCIADGHKAYWQCTTCEFYYADEACTTEIPDLEAWLADETETGGKLTAMGHTYGDTEYKWTEDYSTCSATRTCTVCTEETEGYTETAEATIADEVTKEATCKEAGVRTYTATFAEDVKWAEEQTATEEIAIDETAHAWDNDCDTECNNGCGTTREASHNYESVVTDPSCTVGGFTTHTCSVCGHSYQDSETSAKGCSYSDEWKTDADNHWHVCSVCGGESEKAAHADGNTDHKCDTCEYVMSECSFTVKGDLKTAGTCMAEAVYKANCSVCGAASDTETITGEKDSTNHTGVNHTENAKDADCTNAGYTGDTVCECGATVATGTAIEATGHKNTTTTKVDATCTTDGSVTVTCDACGTTISTETIPAVGHSYSAVVTAPTCEEDGYTTYTCTCGDSYTGDTVPKLGHDYELTDSEEATCTEDGYETYTCKNDASHTYTDTLTKTGHSYESVVTAPTHTEAGYTTYTCSVCGDTYKAGEVAALGHSYKESVTKEATCTEAGVKTFTCTCGDSYTEAIDALGHTEVTHEAKAPTCTEIGWDAYVTCSRCDYTTYAEKAALGHTAAEAVKENEVASTCTATGSYDSVVYCSKCGEELSRETKALELAAHNYQTVSGKAASCTEDGLTDGTQCTVCQDWQTEQTVIPAAHTLADGAAQEKTCTQDGWAAYEYCTKCDYSTKEVIKAGHIIEQGEAQTKTCTQDGWAAYEYCTECDYTTKVVIPAGHTIAQGAALSKTCTQDGWAAYEYCTKCDYTTKIVIPAGHTIAQGEAQTKTCTQDGWAAYEYCTECDYTTKVVIPAGHTIEQGEAQTKTCTQDGWEAYEYCTECDYTTKVVIPAGHTIVQGEAQTKTCTQDGWEAYEYCTECDYTTKVVTPKGHTLTQVEAKAATCTEIGWEAYEHCTQCDHTTYKEIAATQHNIVTDEAVAPTCTTAGLTKGEHCTKCDYKVAQESVPATNHANKAPGEAKAATCTEAGNTAGEYCPDCETWVVAQETIPALGHKFTTYEGNDEIKTAVCDYNCGATDVKIENTDSDTAVDIKPDTTDSDKVNAEVGKEQLDKIVEDNLDIQMNTGILELIFESEAVQDIVKDLEAKDKVTINVENATPEDAENSVRFDIYIAVNDKKQESTQFSGEYVTVTIDLAQLEATLGDPTKDVEIWYVDENGDRIEKMKHEKDGTMVKFKTNHFSYYEVVAANETQTMDVTVNNKTGTTPLATVDHAAAGTIGSDYTITVSCEKACVVAYTTDSGVNYTKIPAVAVEGKENTYSFTVTLSEGMEFAVRLVGDVTEDGKANAIDAARVKAFALKKAEYTSLQKIVGNVTGDSLFNAIDAARIKAYALNKAVFTW